MSRVENLREQYTDNSPAYNMQGSAARHQKELALESVIELISINEKLDKLIELLTPKEEAKKEEAKAIPVRQKVTVPAS